MLDILGTIVTGVMSGGATGLIGIAIQQWGDSRKRRDDLERLKLEHQQARDLAELEQKRELEIAKLGADSAERLATLQATTRIEESADLNYRASLDADRANYLTPAAQQGGVRWLMAAVDFLRGITRPAITWASMALLTAMLQWLWSLQRSGMLVLSPSDLMLLAKEVVFTSTYIVSMCITWWFGVRPAQRK